MSKRTHTFGIVPPCLIIDVAPAALSSTSLPEPFSTEHVTRVASWFSSSVVSATAFRRCVLRRNSASVDATCSTCAMTFKGMPSNAFPPCDELPDTVVETDEMFQNAGEKGVPHTDPYDPPRARANKVRGHGTWDNDRPPIVGTIGRESGQVHLRLIAHTDAPSLEQHVLETTALGTIVNTDEWKGYSALGTLNRIHRTVLREENAKDTTSRNRSRRAPSQRLASSASRTMKRPSRACSSPFGKR